MAAQRCHTFDLLALTGELRELAVAHAAAASRESGAHPGLAKRFECGAHGVLTDSLGGAAVRD